LVDIFALMCVQVESTRKTATMMVDLDDSHGAIELSEINMEDFDLNIDGEDFEYAPTDTSTIDIELKANKATLEVKYQSPRLRFCIHIFRPFISYYTRI